ncbi:MAG: endonuclease III domain-containing protein [Candidatus Woesearchaeota archaeon]
MADIIIETVLDNQSLDDSLLSKRKYFLKIFKMAELKYSDNTKRLASDNWTNDYEVLIATILSAQTRDETTIPVAMALFSKYSSLKKLSTAKYADVLKIISRVNFKNTKAKNVIATAKFLIKDYGGKVPDNIDTLVTLPGVGRKTANLVLSKVHQKDGICVDTHVHRISNVLEFVKTKNPTETEYELMKFVPKKYWSKINRIFVLWGQDVKGKDKHKFLKSIHFRVA